MLELDLPARELVVTVHGTPHGQGSKRMVPGGRFIDANDKRLRPWREAVRSAAETALTGEPLPLHGRGVPVEVAITFTFARSSGHFGTGKNAGVLKASAPAHFTSTPDLDKAIRAIFDAITDAGAIYDDRQVVAVRAVKCHPGAHRDALDVPGAVIRVRAVR